MSKLQKLELTWIGKDDRHENLEPRILIESPEYSYGDMGDTEDPEYDPRSVVKVPTAAVATYQAKSGWKNHNIVGY